MTFKVGDKVRVVSEKCILEYGAEFKIIPDSNDTYHYGEIEGCIELSYVERYPSEFERIGVPFSLDMEDNKATADVIGVTTLTARIHPTPVQFGVNELGLGVYRPNLEDRKVGKVRVELVDDGFPLALREIAKVMTWAQTAKGYKDHDWQSLPNAEVALAAAASRHRTDHIKQRMVDGLFIKQCVDGESELLHKAHEAFGVLAQLELMLRGDIE